MYGVEDHSFSFPLQYACINNHAECVKLLLESKASPQIRNRSTGMVPLHEAASRGHLDCVQIMIAMCVTPLSRTKLDETPADLARKNAFYQCARRLGSIFNSDNCMLQIVLIFSLFCSI